MLLFLRTSYSKPLASLPEARWVVAAEGRAEHEELTDDTRPGRPGWNSDEPSPVMSWCCLLLLPLKSHDSAIRSHPQNGTGAKYNPEM